MPRPLSLARLALFAVVSVLTLAATRDGRSARSQPAAAPRAVPADPESLGAVRADHVRAVLASIAGRETSPAKEVFQNVTLLGDVPAERLVRIMEMGYARSLGVGCDHCHVTSDWASDEKPAKAAARGMIRLVGRLNGELLPAIDGLRSETPTVNCTTCHRGAVTPALNLGGR